jgi:protein-S-isoprenylcysteine O-methyltransferase Ste14
MQTERLKAYVLVAVQFTAILLIAGSGRVFAKNAFLLVSEISGIALGIWAILVMRLPNLNVTPLVKPHASLVTKGPYARIRHPMYLAVLLTIWPLIMDHCTPFRLLAGLILSVDLVIKIFFEERLLKKNLAGYEDYMRTTDRLIPFVF